MLPTSVKNPLVSPKLFRDTLLGHAIKSKISDRRIKESNVKINRFNSPSSAWSSYVLFELFQALSIAAYETVLIVRYHKWNEDCAEVIVGYSIR